MGTETYSHGKETRLVVFQLEILIWKGRGAVDANGARAVAVEEVAPLAHESRNLNGQVNMSIT